MYFFDVLGVIARRWRTVLIGALLTIAAGTGALFAVPTNYQATGQLLLLLPPIATGESTPINPFLNIDPGLTITASLISSTISTQEEQDELKSAGFTGDYAISLVPGVGPLIDISVQDTDPSQALRTRDEVIRRLNVELARIQQEEDAPNRETIHTRENSVVTRAAALPGSKLRALAGVGGLGVVITMIIAFARDRRHHVPASRIVLAEAPQTAPRSDTTPSAPHPEVTDVGQASVPDPQPDFQPSADEPAVTPDDAPNVPHWDEPEERPRRGRRGSIPTLTRR